MKGFLSALLSTLLLVLGVGATVPAFAAAPVEVVGLFKDRAVIRTARGDSMIRVGETSDSGVTLVSADAHGALVRYRGDEYRLALSNRVGSQFHKVERTQISISPDSLGQYRIRGSINNRFVDFLVDTGASVVALSAREADGLGLDYLDGTKGSVQTAQGVANSYFVMLDEVVVGGITAHNVQAAVIEGAYPVEILLGMSFLRQVALHEQGGVLTLTAKY